MKQSQSGRGALTGIECEAHFGLPAPSSSLAKKARRPPPLRLPPETVFENRVAKRRQSSKLTSCLPDGIGHSRLQFAEGSLSTIATGLRDVKFLANGWDQQVRQARQIAAGNAGCGRTGSK